MTDAASHRQTSRPSLPYRIWRSDERRRFWHSRLGMLGAGWLVIFAAFVLIGPFFVVNPNAIDLSVRLAVPSGAHPFGTDDLGRDILSRVLAGGGVTMTVATAATLIPLFIGAVIGLVAGFTGGLVDDVLSRVFDIIITIPSLLYGIILAVVLGASEIGVIIALSISGIALYGRLFRVGVISAKSSEYVQGVVALGFSPFRIVVRHILPNIAMPVVITAASHIGIIGIAEASLSFLGAGIQPPSASLGNIISEGQGFLQVAPWVALAPGIVLTLVAVAFGFVGDALRDAFDVREAISPENIVPEAA